jgi:hypothetical protein
MPEATVLFSVTAAVVVGLVAWVAVVLKTAKEPWARPAPPAPARTEDVPVEPVAVPKPEEKPEAEEKPAAEEKAETDADAEAKAEEAAK